MVIGGLNEDGTPKVVEIDESKFFHRKYNVGHWRAGHWVFGRVERESGRCFLVEVPNRRRETLEELIKRWILPGTHIISDGWAAYAHIDEIDGGLYSHSFVVHQRNFVSPQNSDVHTNSIDNLWMRAKRKFRRQFGTSDSLFESYLHEFIWRNTIKDHKLVFGEFLKLIRLTYVM